MEDAEGSFEAYVQGRIAALSRTAYLLTGDHHLAQDLVQQTLMRVAGRWRRVIAGGDPDAYVRRVLYTQHVSWWRRHRRIREVRVASPPERELPDCSDDLARQPHHRRARHGRLRDRLRHPRPQRLRALHPLHRCG
ncbi:MAG: hypothetical protein IRY92_11470 [Dactylosporangium sp.]|nr:hypothetical protein [Dactylosporangium sp.]